ncbi:nucleoside hydrolase [Bacillus sp. A301a_S52]|nr:nucleoside hydrolase [Bacillus sp. A301a_S52]
MSKKPMILDVDTGIDDALGIILAVKSREFQIAGITTVNGNVSLETATLNTCKILQLINAHHDIPVYKGASAPLNREPYFEHRIHGKDGLGGALRSMKVTKQPESLSAPDKMINEVNAHPGEVTLIMTGPLTNLALAIEKAPDFPQKVKEVIFMGGAVNGPGNVTPVAEYNMFADPEAAKVVIHADFPRTTLVGLDVTRKALLKKKQIDQITNPELAHYVRDSTRDYMQRYYERNGIEGSALHDPLAVAVAIDNQLVTTEKYYVDIETNSELCDGQTVCDFQNRLEKKPNVRVCTDVDSEAFLRLFIETFNA